MERPISTNRWDKPLFRLEEASELDIKAIDAALFNSAQLSCPQATKIEAMFDENYFHELDKACQQVVTDLIQA